MIKREGKREREQDKRERAREEGERRGREREEEGRKGGRDREKGERERKRGRKSWIKSVIRRMQFSQLFVIHLISKKQIFCVTYLLISPILLICEFQ